MASSTGSSVQWCRVSGGGAYRIEATWVGLRKYGVGALTQGVASQALSRGLFRSTGLSEHEGDDHGQGGGVGE